MVIVVPEPCAHAGQPIIEASLPAVRPAPTTRAPFRPGQSV